MRIRKRAAALTAAAALIAGITITAGAGTANAEGACDAPTIVNNSDGTLTFTANVNLHAGPATECANVAAAKSGTTFYAWCGAENVYGNFWVYGRIAGTSTQGWVSAGSLAFQSGGVNDC